MKTVINFIDNWGSRISFVLILIVFLKTCTTNSKVERVGKEVELTNKNVDSLNLSLQKQIKIEGLESERRMIQSTDRDILDVNRQFEIEKIIDSLNHQK